MARPTTNGGPACDLTGDVPSTSLGYNYSEDTSCDWTEPIDTQDGGDPMLAALASNGGPTQTMLPAANSPQLDKIPEADCQTGPATGVTSDQRGLSRPQGGLCDIGAVEVEVPGSDDDGDSAGPASPIGTAPSLTG